jgi:hypothetical protein
MWNYEGSIGKYSGYVNISEAASREKERKLKESERTLKKKSQQSHYKILFC